VVRSFALCVVVIWHWVFSTVRWDAHGPHAGNPLHLVPYGYVLTWFLQVMPMFFFIGGWASIGSLRRHLDRNGTSAEWVARRAKRLVVPVIPLVAAVIGAKLFLSPWAFGTVLFAASPLWFVAVYVPLTILTPAIYRAHQRSTSVSFAASVIAVALVQAARFGLHYSSTAITLLSFITVWGTVYQLGFFVDRVMTDRRVAGGSALLGIVGISAGSLLGFSPSMVTTAHDKISNMGPPTATIIALAVFQLGCVGLLSTSIQKISARKTVTRVVAWIENHQMKIYAIHLPIWTVLITLTRTSVIANGEHATSSWWVLRPVWTLLPALCLAAILSITPKRNGQLYWKVDRSAA
jgi:Acyltransferase family